MLSELKTKQVRGGSRIFFRRGCTPLLLYFNTNKPHSFFSCRIPVVLENRRSSRGGGAHALHPPPRSAPEVLALKEEVSEYPKKTLSEKGIDRTNNKLNPDMSCTVQQDSNRATMVGGGAATTASPLLPVRDIKW